MMGVKCSSGMLSYMSDNDIPRGSNLFVFIFIVHALFSGN